MTKKVTSKYIWKRNFSVLILLKTRSLSLNCWSLIAPNRAPVVSRIKTFCLWSSDPSQNYPCYCKKRGFRGYSTLCICSTMTSRKDCSLQYLFHLSTRKSICLSLNSPAVHYTPSEQMLVSAIVWDLQNNKITITIQQYTWDCYYIKGEKQSLFSILN